ncbi:MAG: DUF1203 domain-containing protein [Candidatus Eremiobacteraeota bacterium]|nr:DUF1203 domain-containing protein [Candidatus Eremiobacteraeota bacterium]
MHFRYLPIDDEVVRNVRATLHDAHGNDLHVQISDDDGNPCRSCLRITPVGTRLILFAHKPFTTTGPYAETGPVFVHADACETYREQSEFPADFRPRTLVLRAYNHAGHIHDTILAPGETAEETLERFFTDPDVATVHVRNPAWGCFDFAVVRAEGAAAA